jgi:hypothetical protein
VAHDDDIADDLIPGKKADRTGRPAEIEREGAAVMSNLRAFKQKLATVSRRWQEQAYDAALAEVEALLKTWPGNAHLHILWASLVQLQEGPSHELTEVKRALQEAIELDRGSPAAAIELGHFFDNVDDDPHAAAKAYADGVASARQLLIAGLIGQAKAYRQLENRDAFLRCVLEVLYLVRFQPDARKGRGDSGTDLLFKSSAGPVLTMELKGPYADQIQELLGDLVANSST